MSPCLVPMASRGHRCLAASPHPTAVGDCQTVNQTWFLCRGSSYIPTLLQLTYKEKWEQK